MKKWYEKYLSVYNRPFDVKGQSEVIEGVRQRLRLLQSESPLITVSVIAYNEERHLLACLWSLSDMVCRYPVEIIGVNNDSSDLTQQVFEACGITPLIETRHSCGWARSRGLNAALGRYHINIDADTMYPPHYVETLGSALMKPGVVCVSSLWSYIPDAQHPWWGVKLYEALRDMQIWFQHFKRPELSVRGLVMGYNIEKARKYGIRTDIIRGEDGYLAFSLKRDGKIRFVRKRRARAVTGYGTVGADGTFWRAFWMRIKKYAGKMGGWFVSKKEYKDEASNLVSNSNDHAPA